VLDDADLDRVIQREQQPSKEAVVFVSFIFELFDCSSRFWCCFPQGVVIEGGSSGEGFGRKGKGRFEGGSG
jgi:hypothetical protein